MTNVRRLTLQLTPAEGYNVSATTQTIDVSAAARLFFQTATSAALGGQFTIDVPINLAQSSQSPSGTDLTKSISKVTITATNDVGTSNSISVNVP